jgi:phage FluMu protein Com
MTDGQISGETEHWAVENGHHLRVVKRGARKVVPKEWECRGCDDRFETKNVDPCPEPTVWVQLGTPGDGVGRCRDCEALFVFDRDDTHWLEQECPGCGSLDWFRTDETDADPEEVLRL